MLERIVIFVILIVGLGAMLYACAYFPPGSI